MQSGKLRSTVDIFKVGEVIAYLNADEEKVKGEVKIDHSGENYWSDILEQSGRDEICCTSGTVISFVENRSIESSSLKFGKDL